MNKLNVLLYPKAFSGSKTDLIGSWRNDQMMVKFLLYQEFFWNITNLCLQKVLNKKRFKCISLKEDSTTFDFAEAPFH